MLQVDGKVFEAISNLRHRNPLWYELQKKNITLLCWKCCKVGATSNHRPYHYYRGTIYETLFSKTVASTTRTAALVSVLACLLAHVHTSEV
jgi:hypothetical protein